MYNEQEQPTQILTLSKGTTHVTIERIPHYTGKGKKRTLLPTTSLQETLALKDTATVSWKDTYILSHHLQTANLLGYTAATPPQSLTLAHLPLDLPPLLSSCLTGKCTGIKVQWTPTEEETSQLREADPHHWQQLLTQYHRQHHNDTMSVHYHNCTPIQQQGIWGTPPEEDYLLPTNDNLQIILDPINPDWDVHPLLTPTLFLHPTDKHTLLLHNMTGQYQGVLPLDTCTWLWQHSTLSLHLWSTTLLQATQTTHKHLKT